MTLENIGVLGNESGYRSTFKRRINDVLLIKEHEPDLKVPEKAFKLVLYNSVSSVTARCDVR